MIANWIRKEGQKLGEFYVHDYLAHLFPEEVDEMTPPHLRGTIGRGPAKEKDAAASDISGLRSRLHERALRSGLAMTGEAQAG